MCQLNNIKSIHDLFGMGEVVTEQVNLNVSRFPKRATAFIVNSAAERPLLVEKLDIKIVDGVVQLTGCQKYVADFILEILHVAGAPDSDIVAAATHYRNKFSIKAESLSRVKNRTAKFIINYTEEEVSQS